METTEQSADAVFLRFDQLVSQLEDEGYPFAFIIEVM